MKNSTIVEKEIPINHTRELNKLPDSAMPEAKTTPAPPLVAYRQLQTNFYGLIIPPRHLSQQNPKTTPAELNLIQSDNDAQLINELDLTHIVNDIVPTVEPVANELNITHTQNDSKQCDKFISINYRRADNSRHTVQIEQFYIDALIAIGITDTAQFVADNAGVSQVTRNVKRSIVNELVKRATDKQPHELNVIQSTSELNNIQSATQSTTAEWLDSLPVAASDGQCTQLTGAKLTKRCKNKAFKSGYCKLHYAEYIKTRR